MNKRDLIKRKTALVHEIVNITDDYCHIPKEDMPADVVAELTAYMNELKSIRAQLEGM